MKVISPSVFVNVLAVRILFVNDFNTSAPLPAFDILVAKSVALTDTLIAPVCVVVTF